MKYLYIAVAVFSLAGCARYPGTEDREERWADRIKDAGVTNFHRVSSDLYRSEQPTKLGMRNLEERGIKTLVSLRAFHSDRDLIKGTVLNYERITFQTWAPDDEELVRFLKIVTDPEKTPVLVHCLHGSDRTGAMCAAYRIVVQGWNKDDAMTEMKNGGYGHHKIWGNLERWIRGLDVTGLRAKVAPSSGALVVGLRDR